MSRWVLVFLLLLLVGADGSQVDPSTGTRSTQNFDVVSRYVCHDKNGTGACAELTGNLTPEGTDIWHFFISNDCTSYTVGVRTQFGSGDTFRTICTLTNTTVDECYIHKDLDGPLQDVILGNVSAVSCAGESLSVIMETYSVRKD